MLKCLDLCAGLGGFSEAFITSPHWDVMRIDNNPLLSQVENMEIIDIFEFHDTLVDMINRGYKPESPDIILASPPCIEFSLGYHSPRSQASRNNTLDEYEPNMDILHVVLDIVKLLKPKYYVIENVRGAYRYFTPILGEPLTQVNSTYYLWGKFPALNIDVDSIVPKSQLDTNSNDPLRSNRRGKIPIQISRAILRAVESQRTIEYYL